MIEMSVKKLVQYGKEVIRFREEFIGQLNEIICEIHRKLSGGKETLKIVYDLSLIHI